MSYVVQTQSHMFPLASHSWLGLFPILQTVDVGVVSKLTLSGWQPMWTCLFSTIWSHTVRRDVQSSPFSPLIYSIWLEKVRNFFNLAFSLPLDPQKWKKKALPSSNVVNVLLARPWVITAFWVSCVTAAFWVPWSWKTNFSICNGKMCT